MVYKTLYSYESNKYNKTLFEIFFDDELLFRTKNEILENKTVGHMLRTKLRYLNDNSLVSISKKYHLFGIENIVLFNVLCKLQIAYFFKFQDKRYTISKILTRPLWIHKNWF